MNLYERYEALSPIYQGGLTNHLPMVLTALKAFGLSEDLITKKLDDYKEQKGLQDLTDKSLGISDFEEEYILLTSKYLGEINHRGVDVILGEFINKHKWKLESALYHGLIRLAYAKEENNPLMLAQAMAYFELSLIDIEITVSKHGRYESVDCRHRVFYEQFKKLNFQFTSSRTMEKYKELLEFKPVYDSLEVIFGPKRDYILQFILRHYEATKCFYNLHLITGFEALLSLEEYIFDFDEVLNHFYLTAQIFVLFNTNEVMKNHNDFDIEQLEKRVDELEDFHDIKLLYSIKKLSKLFDNKLLKTVANTIFDK